MGRAVAVRVAVSQAKQGAGEGVAGAKAEADESGTAAKAVTMAVGSAAPAGLPAQVPHQCGSRPGPECERDGQSVRGLSDASGGPNSKDTAVSSGVSIVRRPSRNGPGVGTLLVLTIRKFMDLCQLGVALVTLQS